MVIDFVAIVLYVAAAPPLSSRPAASMPASEDSMGFKPLFNGKDLSGWTPVGAPGSFRVQDGMIVGDRRGRWDVAYWLSTERQYGDFELRLQYRIEPGGNSGVFIRAPREGRASRNGMEVQIVDDANKSGKPGVSSTGAIYQVAAPETFASRSAGEWNDLWILCEGDRVRVTLNGSVINDVLTSRHPMLHSRPRRGYIGLSAHTKPVQFRSIRLREITDPSAPPNPPRRNQGRPSTHPATMPAEAAPAHPAHVAMSTSCKPDAKPLGDIIDKVYAFRRQECGRHSLDYLRACRNATYNLIIAYI